MIDEKQNRAPTESLRVVVRDCPMFRETYAYKVRQYPIIKDKIRDFVASKMANPLAPYGAKDRGGTANDPIRALIPNIKHAHLTPDISVWYTISGSNPKFLNLYGIYSHDETGTGEPPKGNIQRSMAKRMDAQTDQLMAPKIG